MDYFHCSPTQARMSQVVAPTAGLNVYLRPNVILKASWTNARFYKDDDPTDQAAGQNFPSCNGALVWAC